MLALAIAGLIVQETPAQAMGDGQEPRPSGDWAAALPLFRAADDAEPAIPAYAFARGLAEARAGDPAAAIAALRGAWPRPTTCRWPGWTRPPCAWTRGTRAGAREALEPALRLGRQQPAIVFATGALLERVGDPPVRMQPGRRRSSRSRAWRATPGGRTRRVRAAGPASGDAALAGMSPETAADLWLSSGDAEQASASAARIEDPAARERTELAIAAWDGDATDRAALEAYAQDHPFDLTAVAWAGRVAARAGDLAAVEDYRLWATRWGAAPSGQSARSGWPHQDPLSRRPA